MVTTRKVITEPQSCLSASHACCLAAGSVPTWGRIQGPRPPGKHRQTEGSHQDQAIFTLVCSFCEAETWTPWWPPQDHSLVLPCITGGCMACSVVVRFVVGKDGPEKTTDENEGTNHAKRLNFDHVTALPHRAQLVRLALKLTRQRIPWFTLLYCGPIAGAELSVGPASRDTRCALGHCGGFCISVATHYATNMHLAPDASRPCSSFASFPLDSDLTQHPCLRTSRVAMQHTASGTGSVHPLSHTTRGAWWSEAGNTLPATQQPASCCSIMQHPIGFVWRLLLRRPNHSRSSWGCTKVAQC